jgi:hypothetical protein
MSGTPFWDYESVDIDLGKVSSDEDSDDMRVPYYVQNAAEP